VERVAADAPALDRTCVVVVFQKAKRRPPEVRG
jgi:hypothetical protein